MEGQPIKQNNNSYRIKTFISSLNEMQNDVNSWFNENSKIELISFNQSIFNNCEVLVSIVYYQTY